MPEFSALHQEFSIQWGKAIASVLSQIGGATWCSEVISLSAAEERLEPEIRIVLAFAKGLRGSLQTILPTQEALQLVATFTGAEAATVWDAEQQEAIEELFRQFAGAFAGALKPQRGEVEARLERSSDDLLAGSQFTLQLRDPLQTLHTFRLVLGPALESALQPAHVTEPPTAIKSASPPHTTDNLDLLMHVELGVTLRFGQRQMLLQDILELRSGAVIELDREIQEPVDLLLDGRIIARGQVVVVDGNYGLRVTQLGRVAMEV